MRIDGTWALFDDGVRRPMLGGEIRASDGSWIKAPFLVDTGADRTVFSAAILAELGLEPIAEAGISGLGGKAKSVVIETQIRLTREGHGKVLFRGRFVAVTELEALDLTGLFSVVVDQPGNLVALLAQQHRYAIVRD
jgi:predicted aspartyl protease